MWPFRSRKSNVRALTNRVADSPDRAVIAHPLSDNPIGESVEDALGRNPAAEQFVRHVLSLDVSQGAVVGVIGDWGTGKTSFVNLARHSFETAGVEILDFNPWMFSGAEQLVGSFFVELASQLKVRRDLAELAEDFEDYGEAFSALGALPLVGPWIDGLSKGAKALAGLLQRRKAGIAGRRTKLTTALRKLTKPIVVVLDDIDRLSTSEIREIFKLVRLTASFPNVIYIVAFARTRVEEALSDSGVSGRAYLEKILQVTVDIPALPARTLQSQLQKAISAALETITQTGPFHEDTWPDILAEVVLPLVANLRDVRRYTIGVAQSVAALGDTVALADVLGLEAVRVFMPDVFGLLHRSVSVLTDTQRAPHGSAVTSSHQHSVDLMLEAAGERRDVAKAMVERLFPAASQYIGGSHFGADWSNKWRRDRRVAHPDYLRLYLERAVGPELSSFLNAEKAWAVMADGRLFEDKLLGLPPDSLAETIAALEAFEGQFGHEHAVPGVSVLLNVLPLVPPKPRGMFEFGPDIIVSRVTYRLLRALKSEGEVEAAVRAILPQLKTLSAELSLIRQVGHRPGAGHQLIASDAAAQLEKEWRSRVRSAAPDRLICEPDLLRVFVVAFEETTQGEEAPVVSDRADVTLALLRTALTETLSQSVESRSILRSPQLNWKGLVAVVGSESELGVRIATLKSRSDLAAGDILPLAERYVSGWRPRDV